MKNDQKNKIFKDPIHGYIEVPVNFCDILIDHPIFQRLKHIKQTNMGGLFPSANHNRFAHSLGVFHLGKIAFSNFLSNISTMIAKNELKTFSSNKDTFLIACLMHDCGHSPFSHILEEFYDKSPNEDAKENKDDDSKLSPILLKLLNNKDFKNDFEYCDPQPHEKMSVILLIKEFGIVCKRKLHCDLELASRMILGCKFRSTSNIQARLKNCLIELLNSSSIDVDKTDYILRDTWASGIGTHNIDITRLLSALSISKDKATEFELVFNKRALSVIKSVIDGRNFLYKWIYSHHKVVYETKMLKEAIFELAKRLYTNPTTFYNKVFSLDTFSSQITLNDKNTIHLVTDGDIYYLLKKYMFDGVPSAKILFYRNHNTAIWKTFEEFNIHFDKIKDRDEALNRIFNKAKENLFRDINKIIGCKLDMNDILVLEANPKIKQIKEDQVLIKLENETISYSDVFKYEQSNIRENEFKFFYVYYPNNIRINQKNKNKIIKKMRTY